VKGKLHSFELPYFLVKYNFGTWRGIQYVWERQEMHIGVWLDCLKKKRLFGRTRIRRKDNIERYLEKQDNTRGFIWLMTMKNVGNMTG
jgi:hypothetical protein